MFAVWVSSVLGLTQHFHDALEKQILKFRAENSTNTTFLNKRTLKESRGAWERDLEGRPRALPRYGEEKLLGGGDIRAGVLKFE